MAVDTFSIRVQASLLDGSTTFLSDESTAAVTGAVTEGHGGLPMSIPPTTTDLNIKLGTLSDPKFLKVKGVQGVSIKIAENGTSIPANPWAFLSDVDDGLGISEIWVSNSEAQAASVIIVAAE
jgi:hypothetical protein